MLETRENDYTFSFLLISIYTYFVPPVVRLFSLFSFIIFVFFFDLGHSISLSSAICTEWLKTPG